MKRKILEALGITLATIALILFLGAAGAYENEYYNVWQMLAQFGAAGVLGFVGIALVGFVNKQ